MKNKKSSANGNDTASVVDIAPGVLANLADKLKTDLAKPNQTLKPSASRNREKKTKEKKAKQAISPAQTSKTDIVSPKNNRDIPTDEKKNKSPGGKSKIGNPSAPEKKRSTPKAVNGEPKREEQRPREPQKFDPRQSKFSGRSKASSKANTISATNGKPIAQTKDERPTVHSLLDEILALGGTKEDLELVDDIDSEEDIPGESQPQSSKKSKGNSDKTLQEELQKQLKSLGLTGQFPDESADEESESDWTDEKSEPAKPEPKQTPQKSESTKPRIIDRPVQLSTSVKRDPIVQTHQKPGKLKLEPNSLWYAIERPPLPPVLTPPNPDIINHLHSRGKFLLQTESDNYMSSNYITTSDRQFLSTIMTSGTQSDKLSALTLSITSSPLHCQKQLDALLNMARKKSRNEAVQAIAAIKDLLVGNLLPDRKLVYFGKQGGLSDNAKDEELILWTFEDWLKGWYFQVLQVTEGLSMDALPFARNHMISYIFELLRDKPEQEQLLLRLLVNKLGDGSKQISAKTSYFLLQLQSVHPQMKSIVLHEMENLLFRPKISIHAQYYTIITMNQTVLTSRDTAVANRLVEVYFMLFVGLLRGGTSPSEPKPKKPTKKVKGRKKRGAVNWEELNQQEEEVNSKILSAVLTGVNRAFPFSKVEGDVFEKHMDILFMITHDGNFNTAIQALLLIYQVAISKQIVLDRYYRTLYESLLDRRLTTSSKQALYLNLLFKSLKSDTNTARVKAFIKRIVHITSMHSPGFICGVLFLLAELATSRPDLKSLWSTTSQISEYDTRKRDPLYANADTSSLWELSPLLLHYHPTVQLYAENLLHAQPNTEKPDLALHSVKHFLDRFVYRNPKTKPVTKGASIMQPLPGTDTSLILGVKAHAKTEMAVNSEEWWKQQIDKIKPDEIFFHRYFVAKEEREIKSLGKKRKRGGEDEDEMDEDEIWEALVKSSKEEGGIGDVDVDVDDGDESVGWSDEEPDEDMVDEMNEEAYDSESDEDMDEDVDEEIGGGEGDVNAFFDDEAEEVEDDDEEIDEMSEGESRSGEVSSEESDESGDMDGRFEFGDSPSDIMDSDEEIPIPTQQTNADRSKKRKLKSLPTFASVEDYADLLED